ncbi:MAG: hypothetical protein R3Y44_01085 [Rikenellaceae bacterium]
MKRNKIFSRLFVLATACMAVACAEDASVEMPEHTIEKPESATATGSTLFSVDLSTDKIITGDVYVVELNGTVTLTDNSQALVSHQWSLSENAAFASGGEVDASASDVSYDQEVTVIFLTAGYHTVSVKNRYSEMVSYEFVSINGDKEIINSVEDDNGYYIMEFDYTFMVYSQTYDSLEAKIYTDEACTTEAVVSSSGLVSIPFNKKLYLKDVSVYNSTDEAPTDYQWVETSGYQGTATFENITESGSTASVEFDEVTESGSEVSLRMVVSREAQLDKSPYVSAIEDSYYNGLSKVSVYYLLTDPLVIASIEPYDTDHNGETNQIEITLDSDDVGVFSSESIATLSSEASKFKIAYENSVGNGTVTGQSMAMGSSATSLIVTFDGSIYTDDTALTLSLTDDIESIDSFSARPLSADDFDSVALTYDAYDYLPASLFDFTDGVADGVTPADLGWGMTATTGTTSDTMNSYLAFVDDPLGSGKKVLKVYRESDDSTNSKIVYNSYVFSAGPGNYHYTVELYGTSDEETTTKQSITLYLTNGSSFTDKTFTAGNGGGFFSVWNVCGGAWYTYARATPTSIENSPGADEIRFCFDFNSFFGTFYIRKVSVVSADNVTRASN